MPGMLGSSPNSVQTGEGASGLSLLFIMSVNRDGTAVVQTDWFSKGEPLVVRFIFLCRAL